MKAAAASDESLGSTRLGQRAPERERERDDGVPIGRRLDGKVGSMAWAAQRDLKSCAGVQSKWRKWISSGSCGAGEDDKWVSPL
jgi:hypothetical protein